MANKKNALQADEYVYSSDQGFVDAMRRGLSDLAQSLGMYQTWISLGWRDLRHQTHRTLLGPLWSIVGTGIQVAALGYVYGALLKTEPDEGFPYIAAGLVIWFFISGSILGGLSVFMGGAGVLKERSLPVSFTVFRYTFRMFAELCYKFILFAIVAVLVGLPASWNMFLALPALLLLLLNGLWVILLLGVVGARFRDVREFVSPIMLIAFLATPVLWQKRFLAGNEFIATYNPFTHYLALVREPLLGHVPALTSIEVVLAITLIGWIFAVVIFSLAKNRIVFWL